MNRANQVACLIGASLGKPGLCGGKLRTTRGRSERDSLRFTTILNPKPCMCATPETEVGPLCIRIYAYIQHYSGNLVTRKNYAMCLWMANYIIARN